MAAVLRLGVGLLLAGVLGAVWAVPVTLYTMRAGVSVVGPGSKAGVCASWAQQYCPEFFDHQPGSCSGVAKPDGCHFYADGAERSVQAMDVVGAYNTHPCDPAGTYEAPPAGGTGRYNWPGIESHKLDYCNNGCAETANSVVNGPDGSGQYSDGAGTSKGAACGLNAAAQATGDLPPDQTAGDPAPQTGEPAKCSGATACSGTVNGTTVCVACGEPTTTSTGTSSTKAPDGTISNQTTTTTYQPNSDGTYTQTTTQLNSDGSTTTTTSTGFPGTGGVSSSLGGSKGGGGAGAGGGNCTGNDCGNDSFGGSCGGEFTCDGEAVQCAIAKEQHERDCLMFDPKTVPGIWADGARKLDTALDDKDAPTWSPAHKSQWDEKNFDWASTIDQSNPIAGGCLGDRTIGNFMGQAVVLPLSQFCGIVGMLGNFVTGITAIFCAFILFKGQK